MYKELTHDLLVATLGFTPDLVKYNLRAHGTYFEGKGVKFICSGLTLVTMETFLVQRSRSTLPSMVYATLENALDQKELEAH